MTSFMMFPTDLKQWASAPHIELAINKGWLFESALFSCQDTIARESLLRFSKELQGFPYDKFPERPETIG